MNIFQYLNNRKNILGMNERNLYYIRQFNSKSAKKIADNKLLTKKILAKHEIPTPKLIGYIKNFEQFDKFDWDSLPNSFVIKPVRGLEGAGIEIFYNKDKNGHWIKADGSKFSIDNLKSLCIEILEGKFTPFADPDFVMFEERVKAHKSFKYYTYKGTPDVRIIVFNKIPIMAYLRIPTKESSGKANLAQGAIGAGIDISNGRTTSAVLGKSSGGRGKIITTVPGTKLSLSGLKIPFWESMLESSVKAQEITGLGFLAVDFLIDRDNGPQIVELTARPGLSIQIANQDGMKWRLKKAEGLKVKTIKQGIRLGKDLFGGEIEETIEKISGKELIGILEEVTIFGLNGKESKLKAKIDTGADTTSIDSSLASTLGYEGIVKLFESIPDIEDIPQENGNKKVTELMEKYLDKFEQLEDIVLVKSSHGYSIRPVVTIKMKLGDIIIDTKSNIFDRKHLSYKAIIGRKSLGRFLVDPTK